MIVSDLSFLINPQNSSELIRFYTAWIIVLFVFHMVWDLCSKYTSNESWRQVDRKIAELYSAATVASSANLVSIMLFGFRDHPLYSSDVIMLPLLMAAVTGIVVGLSGLKPKKLSLI